MCHFHTLWAYTGRVTRSVGNHTTRPVGVHQQGSDRWTLGFIWVSDLPGSPARETQMVGGSSHVICWPLELDDQQQMTKQIDDNKSNGQMVNHQLSHQHQSPGHVVWAVLGWFFFRTPNACPGRPGVVERRRRKRYEDPPS